MDYLDRIKDKDVSMNEKQIDLVKFEVAKLELKEGDLLVFRYVGEDVPELEAIECLMESLNTVLPKGVKALILDGESVELVVVHKE